MATPTKVIHEKRIAVSRRLNRHVAGTRPHCVVLGAGLAGLSAAYELTKRGWRVTVAEAEERLGGRVFSHQFDQDPSLVCELGGEWIGKDHVHMKKLCSEFGLKRVNHQYAYSFWEDGKKLKFTDPGKWPLSKTAKTKFRAFGRKFNKIAKDKNLRREIDKLDWWTVLEEAKFDLADLLRRDLMDSTDFGESNRMVSAYVGAAEYFGGPGEGADSTDEMDSKIEGGNSRLVYALASAIGRSNIHTGFLVRKIHQNKKEVNISNGKEWISADMCVCALPAHQLPLIDWGAVSLPRAQWDAALQLDYARITKTAVFCTKRFWPKPNKGGFSVFTTLASDFCFDSTYGQKGDHGILCSYAIGDKADDIAAAPIHKLKDWIAGDVAKAAQIDSSKNGATAEALVAKRQAWQDQPFTRGAYALYRPGQWFTVRPALQESHKRVFFAGEHIADEQGFMEGAVVTGQIAARAVVKYFKR